MSEIVIQLWKAHIRLKNVEMFDLKKMQEKENTRGQEENSRGRKHKKTRRLLITDIECTDVSLKVTEWFSLSRTTNVEALKSDWGHSNKSFVLFSLLPSQTHRGYEFTMKWKSNRAR